MAVHRQQRHARHSRPQHRGDGALHQRAHPHHDLRHLRPDHPRRLLARPAQRRAQGRGLSQIDRYRRYRLLWPRARVLHLQRHPLRHQPALELLPHRVRGRLLEQRTRGRQPRLQAALQGRLLPGAAQRQPAGHPRRDGARDGTRRHPGRKAASRSRHRRPGRNRHALSVAGKNGRLADLVQVHLQERGRFATG